MQTKENLLEELKAIYARMLAAEEQKREMINKVKPLYHSSAVNLVDYLSLRAQSIEQLQEALHYYGLSSLTHSESHIKSQALKLMGWLGYHEPIACEVNAKSGPGFLEHNATALLGKSDGEIPPIMVTFDSNFAEDKQLLVTLLTDGMRVARINCAHDNVDAWTKMLQNLHAAMAETGLPCKIYMDVAGPKIRSRVISKKHRHSKLTVAPGDEIILSDPEHEPVKHGKIVLCTHTGIVENLKPGQRVYFDDGLFEALVRSADGRQASLVVNRISAKKPVIKSDKGINFPDTVFKVEALTDYDKDCLAFIVRHADMVGFSFVNDAEDMRQLQKHLQLLGRPDFPVIAKIETRRSVGNLPAIILQGMQQGMTGVMIARGDMAIEIGFERMSEIQDEILWICEAAHIPVIWATQVLENLHKQGLPTRGEITDAAHAASADCVMINKGEHTAEVLKSLTDILSRSRKNNFKNRRLFRKLSIAHHFIAAVNDLDWA